MAPRLRWPALVLAAGLGTRFRPLSYVRAKPAAPVAGAPIVRRILAWLSAAGVRRVVLNLHHRPESIIEAVGDTSDLGLHVEYSWERDVVLGSAGGPRKALPLLDAPRFLLINGDTLCDVDLAGMVAQHASAGALVTMALVPNRDPARYGGVVVDGGGWVRGFARPLERRRTPSPLAPRTGWPSAGHVGLHFVGVQVVEAGVFADLPPDQPRETVRQVYPALIERHPAAIRAFIADAVFYDVGTPADYLRTCLSVAAAEGLDDLPRGAGSSVAPTARVARSAVWNDVVVGENCDVVESVLADGVRVPPGTRLDHSAVVPAAGRSTGPGESIRDGMLIAPMTDVRQEPGGAPSPDRRPA